MTKNYKKITPTWEEYEEYLNKNWQRVKQHDVDVGAGTFLRRCRPGRFRILRSQVPPTYECYRCGKQYSDYREAAKCCTTKIDVNKNRVSFCTANTVTTIVAKGCIYLQDTFKSNPDLLSIYFDDLELGFERNQFRLEGEEE